MILLLLLSVDTYSQPKELDGCNVIWTSQSKNSGESMPCGGGSLGLNVWVENNEILYYIAPSGNLDENNSLLKSGRIRVRLTPNPFATSFRQELDLKTGKILITGTNGSDKTSAILWVDVFQPVVHLEIKSNHPKSIQTTYENWRYFDRPLTGRATFGTSFKWGPQADLKTLKDDIAFEGNEIVFYHQNKNGNTIFDAAVKQQGLDSVKNQLYNPLQDLVFGGRIKAKDLRAAGTTQSKYIDTDYKGWILKTNQPVKSTEITVYLHRENAPTLAQWKKSLAKLVSYSNKNKLQEYTRTENWWKEFWNRSFIFINSSHNKQNDSAWQSSRNYQLFRYMLASNVHGDYPTKFNGGLFTYDPSLTDTAAKFTPDFRNWGGAIHVAQNQRLVYFPMIKSGDYDLLKPEFDFYMAVLKNAALRSKMYWNHEGACFTEQMENFGLPNPSEYSWKRPADFDKGVEYNAWLEYTWDTVLEFCLMMLDTERYNKTDISSYIPFIESCLRFFDKHYQYLATERGIKPLDGKGQLILFPGSGAETYKMAYNSTSTIAGLKTITERLLQLPGNYLSAEKRKYLDSLLKRIPPIAFGEINKKKTIAPAWVWQRINNTESPQLYPVFPWSIYGVGKRNLDIAVNTYMLDTNAIKFRSHVGWKQDNIFAARLGLTADAAKYTSLKLKNSGRRFPAFWGPGFDWTPDHNWGGSGMIGLQEMLIQEDSLKIYLFPAWPRDWDVHFKLHAPYETTIEAILKSGKLETLTVIPESRKNDIVNLLEQ
ncbi:MAG: DUF5703 domain-containing protein [Candidatus Dadabacteria bacterium]